MKQIHIPIFQTLRNYEKKNFRFDLIAGITVAAVAVPQGMAYAQLAGAPLVIGLYAAFVAMLFFAIFSNTRDVIVGPDAAMAALTGAALLPFIGLKTSEYIGLVSFLALLIGIASFIALAAKLSYLSELLSRPILLGYMAGLALAVIAGQLPKLFGIVPMPEANFFVSIIYTLIHLGETNLPTLMLSVFIGITWYLFYKFIPRFPVSLVVLVGSILLSAVFNFEDLGVALVGTVPTGLPLPAIPRVDIFDAQNLIIPAFAMMAISYANTIATARTFANKQRSKPEVDSSQELLALGMSNVGSGLFSGMPVAASGARTAINHQNHAITQVSQLIGAISIGIVLLYFAPVLKFLPLASLAFIIIMAISKLLDYVELKAIWTSWHSEAILVIMTVLGVTLLGIFQGLLLAVFLAIINTIRRSSFPSDAVLGVAANGAIRDMKRPPKTEAIPGIIMYRFDAPLYFGNANYFRKRVLELVQNDPKAKWFLWDAETITSIDSTAGAMLPGLIKELHSRDITFCVARMKGPARHTISSTSRLEYAFSKVPHYTSMGDALTAFENERDKKVTDSKD